VFIPEIAAITFSDIISSNGNKDNDCILLQLCKNEDLSNYFFLKLDVEVIIKCSHICISFYERITQNSLWKQLLLRDFPHDAEASMASNNTENL
jgi:hypothetical protein